MRRSTPSWLFLSTAVLVACATAPTNTSVDASSDGGSASDGQADATPPPYSLPALWGPKTAQDINPAADVVEVNLVAGAAKLTIGGTEVKGTVGYNGSIPGPTIQAKVGDEVIVHFKNQLAQPTTIHWHGLRISDEMDGNPRIQSPVKPGETFTYRFRVSEPGTFWYHPHLRSNQQLELGLVGAFVIHRKEAPVYDLERVLLLDDILLDPTTGQAPAFLGTHMEIMHGRLGNVLLTNGQASSTASIQVTKGAVERWRLINTANARTMQIAIEGATFRVIGTDGGPLETPYTTKQLLMPVGQRFDVEVSYDQAGQATLSLLVQQRDAAGNIVDAAHPFLTATVADHAAPPRPIRWPTTKPLIAERAPDKTVAVELNATTTPEGGVQWTINGQAHPQEPLFRFKTGETVKLRLQNNAGPEHPFHLHGQFFRVVDDGQPWTQQPGLRDTVLVPGMTTVEIIGYFDNPGRWMAHCHILAHAELGMMGEIIVE